MDIVIDGLTNDVTFHCRQFPRNLKGQYQTEKSVVQATPKAGQRLGDMPLKTLVVDPNSKYYGVPVVWKIADLDHHAVDPNYPVNSVTLIAEKILTLKCFDGREPSNSDSDRRDYGNNRYIYVNMRRWLNSEATAWYAAQHGQDAPPNNTNVWDNKNEYDAEVGFLAGFSANMKNALLATTLTVGKNTVTDGGGYETCSDKIFLASNTEMGLANENGIAEGSRLSAFDSDASRIAYPTAECVSKSEYTNASLNTGAAWYYWLRTPYASNSYRVRSVNSSGALDGNNACYGNMGIRPLCNLSADTMLSLTPNADGSYNIISF